MAGVKEEMWTETSSSVFEWFCLGLDTLIVMTGIMMAAVPVFLVRGSVVSWQMSSCIGQKERCSFSSWEPSTTLLQTNRWIDRRRRSNVLLLLCHVIKTINEQTQAFVNVWVVAAVAHLVHSGEWPVKPEVNASSIYMDENRNVSCLHHTCKFTNSCTWSLSCSDVKSEESKLIHVCTPCDRTDSGLF